MIETETPADKAIVIRARLGAEDPEETARLEEATGLAEALGLDVIESTFAPVRKIDPGRFFGRGKLDEIGTHIQEIGASVAIVDAALSPVQQRNLEKAWKVKVVDRTGLILEIFGLRARTKEGRLQVELARLAYERSRLVRTWTHLERQRGGQGFMGGPVRPRSRRTGACWPTRWGVCAASWRKSAARAPCIANPDRLRLIL